MTNAETAILARADEILAITQETHRLLREKISAVSAHDTPPKVEEKQREYVYLAFNVCSGEEFFEGAFFSHESATNYLNRINKEDGIDAFGIVRKILIRQEDGK